MLIQKQFVWNYLGQLDLQNYIAPKIPESIIISMVTILTPPGGNIYNLLYDRKMIRFISKHQLTCKRVKNFGVTFKESSLQIILLNWSKNWFNDFRSRAKQLM